MLRFRGGIGRGGLTGRGLLNFLFLRLGGWFLGRAFLASVGCRLFRAGCVIRCIKRVGKIEWHGIKHFYDLAIIVIRIRPMHRYGVRSPLTLNGCFGLLPDNRKYALRVMIYGVMFLPVRGNVGQRVEPVLDELDRPFKLLDTVGLKVKPK